MAKRKKPKDSDFEQEFVWFMAGAYVLDVMGLLRADVAAKLSSLESLAGGGTWQERTRLSFGIDEEFVRTVFEQCRRVGREDPQCVAFLLNGLGCPCTREKVLELGSLVNRP